ncbi:MAG: von Willebrand factor type A domain-containing protein [Anaerolineae bacterium]|nr:von Willebrand factor type A domain-containing protein [Anaerolineae bacterium]
MKKIFLFTWLAGTAFLLAACAAAATEAPAADRSGRDRQPEYEEREATEEPMMEEWVEEAPATEAPPEEPNLVVPQTTSAAAPPDDMFFQDYGTNPFVDASADNLSTFAVDVDTGSYTLTRSYLNDGNRPPPEAIRLEEFVNYFEQDYSLPQHDAFNILIEAAPSPFTAERTLVMRVGLQGYDVPDEQRPDATLIFVIDVSGSMNRENRLGAVKESLRALLDGLRPTDQVGIVVYGSRGRVILQPTPLSKHNRILSAINKLQPEGSTNAEEGLRLAYEMATANYDSERINRLVLCSDGVANVGNTGPDAILETVRQQARDGITLTTAGFGMGNYNDVLMEQLADDGDGTYHYVDTQAEARRLFVEGLTGTLLTIAKNAKVQVEFKPQVVIAYRLMGYENRDVADKDFRNNEVDAGEIGAGHSVTALYEVVLSEQAQPTDVVATVRMRWEDPETGQVAEIEKALTPQEIAGSFEQASPRFRLDVAVAGFADELGQGAWAQNADLAQILALAQAAADELPNDPDVQELVHLIELAMQAR